ncbi:MAG: pilus assembly protein N-terminal domain-containing protein, partial [Planctomycetota bacterium]
LLAQQGDPFPDTALQPGRMQTLQLEDSSVSGQVDANLSPNVEKLLKPQYHLEIERRHSQLVVTSKRVRRIAVTDSTVANYVQYSESEISVVGLELGKTDLTLWFEGETMPSIYEVSVIRDASLEEQRTIDFGKLERRLKTLFPNSTVALIPVGAQVLVRGQAYDGEEAQNILQIVRAEVLRSMGRFNDLDDSGAMNAIAASGALGGLNGSGGAGGGGNNGLNGFRDIVINELVIPGEYNIKMRVLVAELNRSELRNAGIDWRVLFNDGRHGVGSTMGGGTGTTLSGIFENSEIQVLIRWLQSNGTIKLLAEPQIVCISGTGASILAGGEFAVPTTIGLGGGQATSFRGFGTSLVVTPTVMDRDLIRLQVVPEFSELNQDNSVNGIPGTNVKRVQTTVELREGQTFAIGGLISRQTGSQTSRIPLFGDIPFIGPRVFQSKNASEVETELLVLVSPEIVRPMEPDEVPPVPGHNVTHPSDHEFWKRGQTEGPPDNQVYQVSPYGSGSMHGVPQGYSLYNPSVNQGAGLFGGGYTTDPINSGSSVSPQAGFGTTPQPQPDHSLPATNGQYAPGGYSQPLPVPPSNYMPQPMPSTPLPPAPAPVQGSVSAPKPSMMTRVTSMFRKEDKARTSVHSAGWTRSQK